MTAMPAPNPGEILLSFVPGVRDWSGVWRGEPVLVLLVVGGVAEEDGEGVGVAAAVPSSSPWFALFVLGVEVLLSLLLGGLGGDSLDWMVVVAVVVDLVVIVVAVVVVEMEVEVVEEVLVVVVVVHAICLSVSF